jgi:putative sterol carrier protein
LLDWPTASEEVGVPVQFLSEEWASELKTRLNASDAFRKGIGSTSARIQQVITTLDGERRYWMITKDHAIDMGPGDVENPDATISQDYDTAAALARGELNAVGAYMSGKLRISGNLMLLMQLQGALGELPRAMQQMDVDY